MNKLNNVVNMFISNSYVDNVKTRDLVQLGQSVQGMNAGHVSFVTVPTGVTDENGDEPPRTADMRALFDADHQRRSAAGRERHERDIEPVDHVGTSKAHHQASRRQPAPARTPSSSGDDRRPQDVTVQVSNSTAKSGLATTATTQLKRRRLQVKSPDDYPNSLNSTKVLFSPGNEQAAATVAASFANSKVERITGTGHVVQVVLGSDFTVGRYPPPAAAHRSVCRSSATQAARRPSCRRT